LWRNPFGELTREERVALAIVDVAAVANKVRTAGTAFQWIGAAGRGKTTRMLALHRYLRDRYRCRSVYVYLPEDEPCPPIPDGDVILIDEAERLPRAVWRRIGKTRRPLVLATHRDLSWRLRWYGYRAAARRIGPANTPELIAAILNRRIAASRIGSLPVRWVTPAEASNLHRKFGGDVRAIEAAMYDDFQRRIYDDGQV